MGTQTSKKTSLVSLPALKQQYLELEARLFKSNAEVYWEQGRVLAQIKAALPHGKWLPWVEKNLNLSQPQTSLRIKVATLPALPKLKDILYFRLENLAKIADVAEKHKLDPDAAAARWLKEADATNARNQKAYAQPAQQQPASTTKLHHALPSSSSSSSRAVPVAAPGMSRIEAFSILGIDIYSQTITPESLYILVRGLRQKHHPDKGGSSAAFTQLTKAQEVLQ